MVVDDVIEPEGLNPVQVEKRILELVDVLSDALVEWRHRFREYRDTEREFDEAYARARVNVDPEVPYNDRKYHADLLTMEQRAKKDVAEAAFRYAEQRLTAVKCALSSWQTVSRSVQQAYGASGRDPFV